MSRNEREGMPKTDGVSTPASSRDGLESDLLLALRARLDPSVVAQRTALLDYVGRDGMGEADKTKAAIDAVKVAISRVWSVEGTALQLMAGMHPATSGARVPRETIKLLMGEALDGRGGGDGYTSRRVEQLEKDLLVPLVATELLGPISGIQSTVLPLLNASYRRGSGFFLQQCNPEMLALHNRRSLLRDRHELRTILDQATRLALMLTDARVIFPASYLYEVDGFLEFVRDAAPLRDLGILSYTAPIPDLDEYREAKVHEYRDDKANPYHAVSVPSPVLEGLPWSPRGIESAADHIGQAWAKSVEEGVLARTGERIAAVTGKRTSQVMTQLRKVPERIEGRAYIGRFVRATFDYEVPPLEGWRIDAFVSDAYLASYLSALNAALLVDWPYGDLRPLQATTTDPSHMVSVHRVTLGLHRLGLADFILTQATWEELLAVRSHPLAPAVIDTIVTDPVATQRMGAAVYRGTKWVPANNINQAKRIIERAARAAASRYTS